MKGKGNRTVDGFTVRVLIASLIAQALVIAIHHFGAFRRDLLTVGVDMSRLDVSLSVIDYLYRYAVVSGCILTFFIISGYLLFSGFDAAGAYKRKLLSRLKTLGVPYVIWNLLASPWVTAALIPLCAMFMPWLGTARQVTFQEVFLGEAPVFFPANAPTWFIRELLITVVLSPLIWRLLKLRRGWMLPALLFAAWIVATLFLWGGVENLTQAFFAVSLGGYFRVRGRDLFGFSRTTTLVCFLVTMSLPLIQGWAGLPLSAVTGIGSLTGTVAILGLADRLATTRAGAALAWMGEAVFFIYLAHSIGRGQISQLIISVFRPSGDFGVLAVALLIWITVIAYLLGLWVLLRRFAPRLLSVVLGGRVGKRADSKLKSVKF